MLESLGLGCNGSSSTDTAQVQAWILIATYESMRAYHRQAWLSAGRAFRLVQMMRLHEIDSPANMLISDPDHTETEERRRVFWMAYFLDHLFSMRNDWPVTLNEHVVSWSPVSSISAIPVRCAEEMCGSRGKVLTLFDLDMHQASRAGDRIPERSTSRRDILVRSHHRSQPTDPVALQ